MCSCYTTVYIYYMFIVFTEATYLMIDEPSMCARMYVLFSRIYIYMYIIFCGIVNYAHGL